jgi:hypothetical protein
MVLKAVLSREADMKRLLTLTMLLVSAGGARANEANDKLVAMPEAERNAVLLERVRAAGPCDRVVRTMLMGVNRRDRASWSVGCADGASYHVDVRPEPGFKPFAITCEDFEAFGKLAAAAGGEKSARKVACWQKY